MFRHRIRNNLCEPICGLASSLSLLRRAFAPRYSLLPCSARTLTRCVSARPYHGRDWPTPGLVMSTYRDRKILKTKTDNKFHRYYPEAESYGARWLLKMPMSTVPSASSVDTDSGESRSVSPTASFAETDFSQAVESFYVGFDDVVAGGENEPAAALASVLVQQFGQFSNLALYRAMIQANMGKQKGSAAELARLLQEMSEAEIQPDSSIHHEALKVLAVHPDAILRGQILEDMHGYWYSLTNDGWHNVIAGLLEEDQLELALETLEEMRRKQIHTQPWLYDLAIQILCESVELDEAVALMKQRLEDLGTRISGSTWFLLFDVACERLHLEAIRFIWQRQVETRNLNPTAGQHLQVLNAAARNGDVELANAVFATMRAAKIDSQPIHFELLMQAHGRNHDLNAMLSVTAVMRELRMPVGPQALEVLSSFLATSPSYPMEAIKFLELIAIEQPIPTATFNCLIEASILHGNFDEAIGIYQQLHRLSIDGPDTSTFNVLFRGCSRMRGKGIAMFFAEEMLALNISPDGLTYNQLLLVCIEEGDVEDALRYYQEMRSVGHQPSRDALLELVRQLALRHDKRAWELVVAQQELGVDTAPVVHHLNENWKKGRTVIDQGNE